MIKSTNTTAPPKQSAVINAPPTVSTQPDVHIHKKEIHNYPEPTWKKVVDAALTGATFGLAFYGAMGVADLGKRLAFWAFSKKSNKSQQA